MEQNDEQWRPVPGFAGYEASSEGRIRSWRDGDGHPVPRALTGWVNGGGYRTHTLMTDAGQRSISAHRLVALAFLGQPPAPPAGARRIEVRHRDGDQTNNRPSNLAYGTPRENVADSIAHGTHHSVAMRAATHCKHGHEFTAENTVMHSCHGWLVRRCRTCIREWNRASRARRAVA